ncbi:MAG: tRNA (N(6)-L-threonylcarbamoyladenosine(37)-C(2))-methylthiotransferase MtaB, partial [Clostridia bacterium]|nr:tRNA (N(6)-L-threonylcarbamoyladenosine(37)-C(2))-methylthiotransferase MtaB [Clostridia bacterium]
MHVFPYSEREGTLAATMPGAVPRHVREDRARELIALGNQMAEDYRKSQLGTVRTVLFETEKDGVSFGYTMEYMHCEAAGNLIGRTVNVRMTGLTGEGFSGEIC